MLKIAEISFSPLFLPTFIVIRNKSIMYFPIFVLIGYFINVISVIVRFVFVISFFFRLIFLLFIIIVFFIRSVKFFLYIKLKLLYAFINSGHINKKFI